MAISKELLEKRSHHEVQQRSQTASGQLLLQLVAQPRSIAVRQHQVAMTPASERTTLPALSGSFPRRLERAPTSTNAAQTLSNIARQCQDDFSSLEHVLLRVNSDA